MLRGIHMTITALLLSDADIYNSTEIFRKYNKLIPSYRHERIISSKNIHSRAITIYAGLFMSYMVHSDTGIDITDITINPDTFGKPQLKNLTDYHFSISHSRNLIVFTGSKYPTGIDAEHIRSYNRKLALRFFSNEEYNHIEASVPHMQAYEFTRLWTMKEAYVKMTGIGLSIPVNSFCVISGINGCHFEEHPINDCIITTCSAYDEYPAEESKVVYINTADILSNL